MTDPMLYTMDSLEEFDDETGAFAQKMLRMFTVNIPQAITQMREAFDRQDAAALRQLAHRIRPSVEAMCVPEIRTHILRIEQLAAAATLNDELAIHLSAFSALAGKAVQQIKLFELKESI